MVPVEAILDRASMNDAYRRVVAKRGQRRGGQQADQDLPAYIWSAKPF